MRNEYYCANQSEVSINIVNQSQHSAHLGMEQLSVDHEQGLDHRQGAGSGELGEHSLEH